MCSLSVIKCIYTDPVFLVLQLKLPVISVVALAHGILHLWNSGQHKRQLTQRSRNNYFVVQVWVVACCANLRISAFTESSVCFPAFWLYSALETQNPVLTRPLNIYSLCCKLECFFYVVEASYP